MGFTRQGKGRSLLLLHGALPAGVIEALAARFEVFSLEVDAQTTVAEVKERLERQRLERPLMMGHSAQGVEVLCELSTRRIPRGLVLVDSARAVSQPLLRLTAAELQHPDALAQRVSQFDAPLD